MVTHFAPNKNYSFDCTPCNINIRHDRIINKTQALFKSLDMWLWQTNCSYEFYKMDLLSRNTLCNGCSIVAVGV